MSINIGLTNEQLQGVSAILNKVLANEYLLYTKTRNFHWNVVGPQFHDLHKAFQALYEELDIIIDEVAERIRSLGQNADGTLSEFLKNTTLKEYPRVYPKEMEMVKALLEDVQQVTRELRVDVNVVQEEFQDAGTADFLTGVLEKHEKTAWMLGSLLG